MGGLLGPQEGSRAVGRGEGGADGTRAGLHEDAHTHRARGLVCVFVTVASVEW